MKKKILTITLTLLLTIIYHTFPIYAMTPEDVLKVFNFEKSIYRAEYVNKPVGVYRIIDVDVNLKHPEVTVGGISMPLPGNYLHLIVVVETLPEKALKEGFAVTTTDVKMIFRIFVTEKELLDMPNAPRTKEILHKIAKRFKEKVLGLKILIVENSTKSHIYIVKEKEWLGFKLPWLGYEVKENFFKYLFEKKLLSSMNGKVYLTDFAVVIANGVNESKRKKDTKQQNKTSENNDDLFK